MLLLVIRVSLSFFLISVSQLLHAQIDEALLTRLKTEAVPIWKNFETKAEVVTFACTNKSINEVPKELDPTGKIESTEEYECVADLANQRVLTRKKYGQFTQILGCNPDYQFDINNETDGEKFILKNGSRFDPQLISPLRGSFTSATYFFGNAFLAGVPLSMIFEGSKDFTIQSCRMDEDSLIEVSFSVSEYGPSLLQQGNVTVKLDPENSFRVARWQIENVNGFEGSFWEFEHEYSQAKMKTVTIDRSKNGQSDAQFRITFDTHVDIPFEDDSFRLPYYGISESSLLPPARPWTWVQPLILIVSVLLIVTGVWLWRRS